LKEKKKIMPISTSSRTRKEKVFRSRVEQKEIFSAHKCKKARTREKKAERKAINILGVKLM
jgi:hypothetical protein